MTKSVGKRIFIIFVAVLFTLLAISPSLAWLAEIIETHFPQVDASTLGSYFESGNGSPETPYVITNPVHLYNLAWLQYIGYFNMGEINNRRAQSYFKLGNNVTQIDMTGWELPPIGTTQYPFIGNFDGNGASIVNLTTTNDQNLISKKPSNAKFLAVNDLLSVFVKENASGADQEAGAVIGFFGVVGDFGNHLANLNGQGVTVSTATPPQNKDDNTVYQQEIAVNNFGLYNYTLHNNSSQTLVGFVAGYANAPITNVQVGNGTLQTETTFASYQPVALTSAISDYLLVGYATEEYKSFVDTTLVTAYLPTKSQQVEEYDAIGMDGDAAAWGGSIAMSQIHQNLTGVVGNKGSTINNYVYYKEMIIGANDVENDLSTQTMSGLYTTNLGNKTFTSLDVQYNSASVKPYCNVISSSSDTVLYITGGYRQREQKYEYGSTVNAYVVKRGDLYLNLAKNGNAIVASKGATATTKWAYDGNNELYADVDGIACYFKDYFTAGNTTEYYISSGTNYLSLNNAGDGITNTNKANATTWAFSNTGANPSGYISTVNGNGNTVYLRYNSGLAITTNENNRTSWTNSSSKLNCKPSFWSSTRYYIYLNNNSQWATTSTQSNGTTLTFTAVTQQITQSGTMTSLVKTDEKTRLVFNENNSTYIPLQMQMNGNTCLYVPKDNNTGYITSGNYSSAGTDGRDVRISQYSRGSITNANIVRVWDKESQTYVDVNISNYLANPESYSGPKLEKFDSSVGVYNNNISSYLYGLHFMRGRINVDSLVTIPTAVVNGERFDNYQVPADCIDFSLKEKGHINFYAGTYYNGSSAGWNNYFFTLHHIYRYEDEEQPNYKQIKEIKEISKIYEHQTDLSKECYYLYTDGTYATYEDGSYVSKNSLPAGYELSFDMTWITAPAAAPTDISYSSPGNDWTKKAYYFEIPASPGEYALGSSEAENKNGAYLLYLDISANAQKMERRVIFDGIRESYGTNEVADGVYFSQSAESVIDENERASASIQAGYGGTINASRQDDTITITHTNDNASNVQAGVAYGGIQFEKKTENSTASQFESTYKTSSEVTTKRVIYVDKNLSNNDVIVTIVTRTQNADNTVTISGTVTVNGTLDQERTNSLIKDGSTNDVTYLKTTKNQDSITWSEVTVSTDVALCYTYSYLYKQAEEKLTATNDVQYVYTPGETTPDERYVVTVTSSAGITIEITTLGDIPAYFNGSETPVTANGTVEVSPS